jgi:hypothetical protein
MRWCLWMMLLACAGSALGRTARVGSCTGQVLQGQVRLTERGLVVVNAAQEVWQEVSATNLGWAVFDASPSVPAATAPEALPEPWLEQDIGRTTVRGDTLYRSGAFTVRSSGLGMQGPADSFHFVLQPAQGESEIVAYLSSIQQSHPSARAGLIMRENLSLHSRQVMIGVTPWHGGFVESRDQETAGVQCQTQSGWGAPCWLKLKRESGTVAAYRSRNGLQWTLAGRVRLPLYEPFYVGLATASGRPWTLNWTTFEHVAVGSNLISQVFPPRAELVSGSVVVGRPVSMPGDQVDFQWGLGGVSVPARSIARLLFQWAPPAWLGQARQNQSGVWLANGEFLEGDFRTVESGHLRVSSVLYGAKTFDANNEVVMVNLHRDVSAVARYEVRTVNGSVWRAQTLAFGDNEVILQEPALGKVIVPLHELASIQRR